MTPLLEALRGGHDAAAQILVNNGAKPILKVCPSMSILAEPDWGSGLCTRVKPQGGGVPKKRALNEVVAKSGPAFWESPPFVGFNHRKAQG
jgi:hypothetical protein